jgi:hypothetical protein
MQASKSIERDTLTTDDYNSVPVYFCKNCLSLKIRVLGEYSEYCDDCGSTDIETTHIDTWREMYKEKHGRYF